MVMMMTDVEVIGLHSKGPINITNKAKILCNFNTKAGNRKL